MEFLTDIVGVSHSVLSPLDLEVLSIKQEALAVNDVLCNYEPKSPNCEGISMVLEGFTYFAQFHLCAEHSSKMLCEVPSL